jgi:hypothetical protein
MNESRDSSLGSFIGWIAVLGGSVWLALGIASIWKGQGTDGVDGLVFGGLAFVAGCVILYRRSRILKNKQNLTGHTEVDVENERKRP